MKQNLGIMAGELRQREYLNRTYNLVVLPEGSVADGLIEVPEGAELYTRHRTEKRFSFYKDNGKFVLNDLCPNWTETTYWDNKKLIECEYIDVCWQREQPLLGEAPAMMHNTSDSVELTLADRQSQYGEFKDVAITTSRLFALSMNRDMSVVQEEALHMICSKLARIANGDPNHVDSWHDIAGYATLVVKDLEK